MHIGRCPSHGYYRGNSCECGSEGETLIFEGKIKPLGKIVSGALRHFPDDIGVSLDSKGWADIEDLLRAIGRRSRYGWLEKEHIVALVVTDEKGRYEIRNGKIRATYGHTVDVEPDLPKSTPPDELYYGSSHEEAGRIEDIGLVPSDKNKVHLSESSKTAIEVASSSTEDPVLIVVRARKAQKEDIDIRKAAKHLWVADKIPPKYLYVDYSD